MRSRRAAESEPEGAVARLAVRYDTPDALGAAFARELGQGAVFVPGTEPLPPGSRASVALEFRFRRARLELEGEVVASLPERVGATPGVSVQLREPPDELRHRVEAVSGVRLPPPEGPEPGHPQRAAPRFPARTPVAMEAEGRRFCGETANVSYNGVLVMLSGIDLGCDTPLRLQLQHPRSGEKLELDGRVANQALCEHGVMAVGVQFLYGLERFDEVQGFVDDVRAYHHARALATVSGSLRDTPLEDVIETFSNATREGTLHLCQGSETGKLVYRDGELVHASAGLVSGTKALGRMFSWADARFEFQPDAELLDATETALPIAAAVLAASVERDDCARLDLGPFSPETSFQLDGERLAAVESTLDPLARRVCDNAGMGFPLAALLDMLTDSDAAIYRCLVELVEAGVLRMEAG